MTSNSRLLGIKSCRRCESKNKLVVEDLVLLMAVEFGTDIWIFHTIFVKPFAETKNNIENEALPAEQSRRAEISY